MKKIFVYEKILKIHNKIAIKTPSGFSVLPPVIMLAITYQCNLKCKTCPLPDEKNIESTMSIEDAKNIIDNIKKSYRFYPFKPLIWVTGGELFTHKNILEILDYINECGLKYGFTTNGTLLTKRIIERILTHNVFNIRISLDGARCKHDTLRGVKGTYDKALQTIKTIRNHERGKGIPIVLACVINPENTDPFSHLLKLSEKYDLDVRFKNLLFAREGIFERYDDFFIKVSKCVSPEDYKINYLRKEFKKTDIIELLMNMKLAKIRAKEMNNNINFSPSMSDDEFIRYFENDDSLEVKRKSSFVYSIAIISPNGTLIGCGKDISANVKFNKFSKVWNSSNGREFRRLIAETNPLPKLYPITCE